MCISIYELRAKYTTISYLSYTDIPLVAFAICCPSQHPASLPPFPHFLHPHYRVPCVLYTTGSNINLHQDFKKISGNYHPEFVYCTIRQLFQEGDRYLARARPLPEYFFKNLSTGLEVSSMSYFI